MTKHRTEMEVAAGKLISAIQKEWGKELGDPVAEESYKVMSKGHCLLQAANEKQMRALLNGESVTDFLGQSWVERHQSVVPAIKELEEVMLSDSV